MDTNFNLQLVTGLQMQMENDIVRQCHQFGVLAQDLLFLIYRLAHGLVGPFVHIHVFE